MAQTIQIKRSTSSAAPSSSLAAGELAYTSQSDKLFIGHPDGSTGNLLIGSTVPWKLGADNGADLDINIQDLVDFAGDTAITTSVTTVGGVKTVQIDLDDTATDMTTTNGGQYGSSTAIPVITVDRQGRISAISTDSISTTLTIQTDDAVDNGVALASDKLKILGGTGLTTSNSGDDVTINVDTGGISNGMLANDSTFLGSTELTLGDTTGTTTTVDGMEVIHGVDGSGTDAAGTNLTFKAGAGTGAGAGGSILFQVADGTTSGTSLNSFTTAMTITDDGAVTIAGNLTVNGTTTTVNSNTVDIGDSIILLNSDETGTPSQNAGIEIERGTATNLFMQWNETTDFWEVTERDVDTSANTVTIASPEAFSTSYILTKNNFTYHITTLDGGTF